MPIATQTAPTELRAYVPEPGSIVVEASTNLVDWQTVPFATLPADEQISIALAGTSGSKFYRLKISN